MLFPKISSPFKRYTEGSNRNKLIIDSWSCEEFKELRSLQWLWTEKIDGMNLRIIWDGYRVTFAGRTDRAQIPGDLLNKLNELFPEELLEQTFGASEVILFGEGFGAGIQSGGNYSQTKDFILFDIKIGDFWLLRDKQREIAASLGINIVPVRLIGSVWDAINMVSDPDFCSVWSGVSPEGLVGVTSLGLLNRAGNRIAMKIKVCDFAD
jgi:hypothetical protein